VLYRGQKHRLTCVVAWLGTVGVLAVRFILFLIQNPGGYQACIACQAPTTLDKFIRNFGVQIVPVLSYFPDLTALSNYLLPFVLVLLLSIVLLALVTRSQSPSANRRRLIVMVC